MKTADFHPARVQTLVFDLDSLTGEFSQEQRENFRELLRVLQNVIFTWCYWEKKFLLTTGSNSQEFPLFPDLPKAVPAAILNWAKPIISGSRIAPIFTLGYRISLLISLVGNRSLFPTDSIVLVLKTCCKFFILAATRL